MKTIIEMAREAGAAVGSPAPNAPEIIFPQCLDVQRFAELVRAEAQAEEREREAATPKAKEPEQGASLKMQDIVCPNCGDMARTWPKQERTWAGLTREEINSALGKYSNWYNFAAHLENILKEKNQ